jgi:DNA-binding Lrp family transcriptional regulator
MSEIVTIPATNGKEVVKSSNDNFDIMVLKFSDSRIPEFKEVNNKNFVLYGEQNDYPEYLLYQYKKCGKHRAIINGKSKYIFGGGLEGSGGFASTINESGIVTAASFVNRKKETMADILKKCIKDNEIYGGSRLFVTWNLAGKVAEITHDDFNKFRTGKNGGFYWKDKWFDTKGRPNNKEIEKQYDEFTGIAPLQGKNKIQVFAYNEYEPGADYYPLPEYVGCANYIDIDIEISKFHLSAIRNGMMPSKMIQFYTGEPSEDKKKEIEKRFAKKFAGSENAGKFVLVFNSTKDKSVDISDLSFSELDKQFDLLAKQTQQEIFTGHQVISPMLFGVKTEGQLGGNTELRTAYEIFINTYAKPKQENLETMVNYFGELMGKGSSYKFIQLDPIGLIFDAKDFLDKLPLDFVFEKLGISKKYITPTTVATLPAPGVPAITEQQQAADPVNENIKNLTAKQHQQLLRIIRQYGKGQITKEQATVLLKTGLGLNDSDIASMLGIEEADGEIQKFVAEIMNEDNVIQMFNSCGDLKKDFHIIKSRKVKFGKEVAEDEIEFYQRLAFKTDVTITEASILDLITKDKRITPEVIAKTLDTTPEYVTAKIAKLVKGGLLDSKQGKVGEDTVIERTLTKPLSKINVPPGDLETTEILVKYSYEGPQDNRNRPFCAKLLSLDRIYSRTEIENISSRLGYSVWDRRGGWWTKPDGTHSPSCRHRWESHIVVRKKSLSK